MKLGRLKDSRTQDIQFQGRTADLDYNINVWAQLEIFRCLLKLYTGSSPGNGNSHDSGHRSQVELNRWKDSSFMEFIVDQTKEHKRGLG